MRHKLEAALRAEYAERGQVVIREPFLELVEQGPDAIETKLEDLRSNRRRYIADAIERGLSCSEMLDVSWCIESAFVAEVPAYAEEAWTLDNYLRTVMAETLDSPLFVARFRLDLRPLAFVRGDEGDADFLDGMEDRDGHKRGTIAGTAFTSDDDDLAKGDLFAEVHVSSYASALIVLHEIGHLLDDGQPGHSDAWLGHFRDLVSKRYGAGAGEVFDRAAKSTEVCSHGSRPPDEVAV